MLVPQILQMQLDVRISSALGFENVACGCLIDAVWEAARESDWSVLRRQHALLCHSLSLHAGHVSLKDICDLIEVKAALALTLLQI